MIICLAITAVLFIFSFLYFHRAQKRLEIDLRVLRSAVGAQKETFEIICEQNARIREDFTDRTDGLEKRIINLESGIVPDFEAAKKAAKSVNDFNTGLSAIMGYDPLEAVRKSREASGGEA